MSDFFNKDAYDPRMTGYVTTEFDPSSYGTTWDTYQINKLCTVSQANLVTISRTFSGNVYLEAVRSDTSFWVFPGGKFHVLAASAQLTASTDCPVTCPTVSVGIFMNTGALIHTGPTVLPIDVPGGTSGWASVLGRMTYTARSLWTNDAATVLNLAEIVGGPSSGFLVSPATYDRFSFGVSATGGVDGTEAGYTARVSLHVALLP